MYPLRWFESYLENRSQRVVVNGAESRSFDIQFGLAQGSCLGPLLFTIYTGELFDIIKPHLPSVMCYADDTQLYLSFSPKDNCGEVEAIAAMERCIKDTQKWMKEAKLQLNTNSDNLFLEIEKVKTYTTLGDRTFQAAAPKLWNNLPFNIRSSLFLPSFKKALKTYLFREAFS